MRNNPYERILAEERDRLLREIGSQKMSWRKRIGKMMRLNALMRLHDGR